MHKNQEMCVEYFQEKKLFQVHKIKCLVVFFLSKLTIFKYKMEKIFGGVCRYLRSLSFIVVCEDVGKFLNESLLFVLVGDLRFS